LFKYLPQGNFGSNHASTVSWTPAPVSITYGDSVDIWGLTLTPDSVNNAGFGFRIMIRNGSAVVTAAPSSVDHIQMTVYYSVSTGTFSQTRTSSGLTIYPNPVSNQFTIYHVQSTVLSMEVYNMIGEKILQPETSNLKPQTVDVSQLPSGIYFAVIDTGKEKIIQKFVKSNY
jgi:hypothetical protein